ncbi:thioesterase family protein [Methylobacterium sp. BTF04]|nr:thioesterase family protein [Methylobacterium sp. BTF04]
MVSRPAVPPPQPDTIAAAAFVPSASLAARPVVPVASTGPRFRLDDPEGGDSVRSEPARLNPATGRREDGLARGDFAAIEAPYLRITVTDGAASEPPPGLFVTLVRRGADGPGLSVIKTGERGRLDTKFGPVETLEATLSGNGRRICTGFATLGAAAIRVDGWLCAPLGQPPEPRAIACALDALILNGPPAAGFETAFRTVETRRDPGCATAAGAMPREIGGQTGSIDKRRARKIKAELRRTAQARP